MRTSAEVKYLQQIIDAVHCPECGQPAAAQGQTPYEVVDVWACDTDGCSFHWRDGDRTWTLGLSS